MTHGKAACGSYSQTLNQFKSIVRTMFNGTTVEVPVMATVDGEMVTQWGAGVDIFRVHNGKITDHWDASPPAAAAIKAHPPGTAERVMSGFDGPGPAANLPGLPAAPKE